jgi:hypothetical protein
LIPDAKLRTRIAIAFLLITVLLLYFPFLVTPAVQERGRGGWRQRSEMGEFEKLLVKGTVMPGEIYDSRLRQ